MEGECDMFVSDCFVSLPFPSHSHLGLAEISFPFPFYAAITFPISHPLFPSTHLLCSFSWGHNDTNGTE